MKIAGRNRINIQSAVRLAVLQIVVNVVDKEKSDVTMMLLSDKY
jgi:hypothetical protein